MSNETKTVGKFKSSMIFPRDNYVVRCTEDEFGQSNKGNAMFTLNFEIDRPEEIEIAGERVNVAGVKTQPTWVVTKVFEDGVLNEQKSAAAIKRANELMASLGEPPLDPENPQLALKGKLFHVRAFGKSEPVLKAQTAEQRAAGKPGDPIKNPITGEAEIRCSIVIEKFYGPAEAAVNKSY